MGAHLSYLPIQTKKEKTIPSRIHAISNEEAESSREHGGRLCVFCSSVSSLEWTKHDDPDLLNHFASDYTFDNHRPPPEDKCFEH